MLDSTMDLAVSLNIFELIENQMNYTLTATRYHNYLFLLPSFGSVRYLRDCTTYFSKGFEYLLAKTVKETRLLLTEYKY